MAPPDEPTAEEDLLKRLESPPGQHRVADPGRLPEVTLDGSRAAAGVDVGECRRDDRGDLGRRGGRHPAQGPVEPTHVAADDVPLPPERLRRRHVGAERHRPGGLPIDATRCPAPPAMSSSTTGGPCSRKSALPAQKAATASGVERSRTKVTRAGSRPWRRRTACMQSHGVGAPPNEITVRPTRSAHAKRRRGSRLRRKNPLRSLTAAKWTRRGPPRSTSSKLRMRPPRARSALPLRSASTVPPPCVAVVSAISRPSAARWPP